MRTSNFLMKFVCRLKIQLADQIFLWSPSVCDVVIKQTRMLAVAREG